MIFAEISETFWLGWSWDVALSAGLFLSVSMFVLAVFGQQGEIKLSPQRAAAIATGHTDRKTLFENVLFKPFLWIFLAISYRLRSESLKRYISKQLTASGNPNYYTPQEFLALSFMTGFGLGMVLELLHILVAGSPSISVIILGIAVGSSLCIIQLADQSAKRMRSITRQLPYALDLISLAMGAGANFTEAVRTIVDEDPQDSEPLNVELRAMLAEIELGTTRQQALANMAQRVPLDSIQSLASAVTQAQQLGTPLANVLHDQASALRLRRSVRAENLAATASVRILVPCLLLVMAVILTIFGPAIIRIMRGGLF
ncbi:MAG TPA: type II secretion system F family protein [Phycisphaerae bacterium]|nr:type II secretion system F family protein [Phycisphaerae bacterium]HPS52371.1 type II secretion system F family protein [Phycisphaerae bacterium]